MPYPKLSAVLNNCPLHALTPELKAEIIKFRDRALYVNQHNADYDRLKRTFADFYGFEPDTFTWKQFADLLERYNAFDTQIILGPVLRLFMKEKMPGEESLYFMAVERNVAKDEYIRLCTETNRDTGRYESLGPQEVFNFVAKHLGISIHYFAEAGNNKPLNANDSVTVQPVEMYHQGGVIGAQSGGHWERTRNGESSVEFQKDETTQLTAFLPFLGEDPNTNPIGFELLKKHIQLSAKAIAKNQELVGEFSQLYYSAALIERYLFNIAYVPKALAIELLGDNLPQDVQRFIAHYHFNEVNQNLIYERWIKAHPSQKPHLEGYEKDVIQSLVEPIIKPFNPEQAESGLENQEVQEISSDQQDITQEHLPEEDGDSLKSNQEQTKDEPQQSKAELQFDEKLELLRYKIDDLEKRKAQAEKNGKLKQRKQLNDACIAASELYNHLVREGKIYFQQEATIDSYKVFKKNCNHHIRTAREVLDNHRGWSEFLTNLALAILTAGIGLLIKGGINLANNKQFFFVHKTDSAKKLDEIEEEINQAKPDR